jgi:purine-cytosine permease-like protein
LSETGISENVRVGAIEQRGLDLVSAGERHGKPLDLFFMWFGTNTNVFYIINGALLISLGLNFLQSALVILLGNLCFFLVGLTSLQGPATGTATFAINRAAYGVQGGKFPGFMNWLTVVGFEGSGVALAVIALLTLAGALHIPGAQSAAFKVVVILLVAGVQLLTPLFGHATIMVVQKVFAYVFAAFFLILSVLIAGKVQLSGGHAGSLATITLGVALMISAGGISWANTGSDYSRYLPANSSRSAIFWAASLGGMIPAVLLELVGAAVATLLPGATDPISGLPSALPGWFLVPYLVVLFVNLLAVNSIDLYSSGLTLQVLGVPVKRWQATFIDMVVCVALAALAVFSSNFNTLYSQFLSLLIVFLAPWVSIYLVDSWKRRNRYDAPGLLAGAGGAYWYSGGVHWPGVIAQVAGMVAALLWLNSPIWVGPLSKAFGGSDMSVFLSALVAGGVYLAMASGVRAERAEAASS